MSAPYVYVSKNNCTVTVRETISTLTPVGNGAFKRMIALPAIQLVFNNRSCEVNEQFAKRFQLTLDELHKLIEEFRDSDATMRSLFKCVSGPGLTETEEAKAAIKEADDTVKKNTVKVSTGVKDSAGTKL